MKFKRLLLVVFIIIVFVGCIIHMNLNFDELSRYPYVNESSRELIRQYLDEDEINYIIEYDIAPSYFKEYLIYPNFNIYHVESYNIIKNSAYYLTAEEVVNFTEELINIGSFDEGSKLIQYYSMDEVLYWLNNGDPYNPEAKLVKDPNNIKANLDKDHTLSIRKPYDLENKTINQKEVYLRIEAMRSLLEMIEDMPYELYISDSFISYEDQVLRYQSDSENLCDKEMPGHSEHQLGLAIDLDIAKDSKAYKWLLDNSHNYGFYFTNEAYNHLRYKGVD